MLTMLWNTQNSEAYNAQGNAAELAKLAVYPLVMFWRLLMEDGFYWVENQNWPEPMICWVNDGTIYIPSGHESGYDLDDDLGTMVICEKVERKAKET